MRQFIATLDDSPLVFEDITKADIGRITELLNEYADNQLDFVDAAITAVAERLNIQHILTVDQRDFRIIRPKHCDYFEILP
jgi:predicted nucleic acid-binding protein